MAVSKVMDDLADGPASRPIGRVELRVRQSRHRRPQARRHVFNVRQPFLPLLLTGQQTFAAARVHANFPMGYCKSIFASAFHFSADLMLP